MARLLKSPRKIGRAPTITVRARKRPFYTVPNLLEPIVNYAGMNQPETRVAMALADMNITYEAQVSFMGGSILGGARADFILPAFRIALLVSGPFHSTSYGLGRDLLVNQTYEASGYRVIHFTTDLVNENLHQNLRDAIGVPLLDIQA